jgi:phage FluMu protein Com
MSESSQQSTDIISKLSSDNVLAQRFHCGGCQRLVAQVEDPQLVPIKCKDCRENEMYSKEGPRQAVFADANGDIRISFIDSLIPIQKEKSAAEGEE